MVPEGSRSSLIRPGPSPGWVISAQLQHRPAPAILLCHRGLKLNEDSLLPYCWADNCHQLSPLVERAGLDHVGRPPLLALGNGGLPPSDELLLAQEQLFANDFSKLDTSSRFLFAGVWNKAKHIHDSQKNIPLPRVNENHFREKNSLLPKMVLLNSFSWWKALLTIIFLSPKLSRHLQHLFSPPHSFRFPRPGVPTSVIFLALALLHSHASCPGSRCHIFLFELLMTSHLKLSLVPGVSPSIIFFKIQIWYHFTGTNICHFSNALRNKNSNSLA